MRGDCEIRYSEAATVGVLYKAVPKNSAIFEKSTCGGVFFDKVVGLKVCNFIEKRLNTGDFW